MRVDNILKSDAVRMCVSIKYLSSSGVPQRDDTAKKLVTWYQKMHNMRVLVQPSAVRRYASCCRGIASSRTLNKFVFGSIDDMPTYAKDSGSSGLLGRAYLN